MTSTRSLREILVTLCLTAAACGGTTGSGGTVQFTASGEVLALGGYPFPPGGDDPVLVDGWALTFDELIVTLDKLRLSEDPDTSPTDQSQTGKLVALVDGPWVVDLHRGGPLAGKGGGDEQAVPIASVTGQNQNGNQPFDGSRRYAFGFDVVAASAAAHNVNLDAQGMADYQAMIQNGWTVFYAGTATWKGTSGGRTCQSTNGAYDFGALPASVKFRLGFASPATYVNCQNPDNDPARALGDEEHQRGLTIKSNQATVAQATIHADHPFWESFTHDTPAHFDQLAAQATSDGAGGFVVTMDATAGVDPVALTDAKGQPLPWRWCDAAATGYVPPNMNKQMGFDTLGIPYDPKGDPASSLRDLRDFMTYNQSTQGHLNSDGLCYVERHYPSPR